MLKLALTPRWLAGLLLALVFATGFMLLSRWQLGSASSHEVSADPAKEAVAPLTSVAAPLEPVLASEADTMVRTTGHYERDSSVLVGSRVKDGEHGYWVVARFVPDEQPDRAQGTFSVAVARGFTADGDPARIPAEPEGELTVIGRLVANEGPVSSEDSGDPRILGSAATAELTNTWQAPLYAAPVTADAEVPAGDRLPLDGRDHLTDAARLSAPDEGLVPIRAQQYTSDSLNWLNVFYAAEWVVFAGFALFLWWRMLADSHRRRQHPEEFFDPVPAAGEEGRIYYEQSTGRYFYYDAEAGQYYYFDDAAASTDPTR